MSTPARLAAAAVIAIVVVGGGVYALGSQPSGIGGPTSSPTPATTLAPTPEPTPVPTEDPSAALAAFRAARDAVCLAGSTAKIPLVSRYEWIYAETATEAQRADGIAALAEFVVLVRSVADELEAITAPSDIQTEHIANVTQYRALATILERSLELLNDGNFADAKVVDETTNPIGGEIGKWEIGYKFTGCP